jgi:hypothetical protein
MKQPGAASGRTQITKPKSQSLTPKALKRVAKNLRGARRFSAFVV